MEGLKHRVLECPPVLICMTSFIVIAKTNWCMPSTLWLSSKNFAGHACKAAVNVDMLQLIVGDGDGFNCNCNAVA